MIIELVRTFYPKNVPAKFQKYLKHISWVISGTSSSNCHATLVIAPETPVATIVTICCNHRDGEYFLHRITRKLGSTATSTVIARLLPLTDYISGAENETLRALSGHTNVKIEMRSPSAAAMMTMVAAATIVRFPPVLGHHWFRWWLVACSAPSHCRNQCWLTVNYILKNKLQRNLNQNTKLIRECPFFPAWMCYATWCQRSKNAKFTLTDITLSNITRHCAQDERNKGTVMDEISDIINWNILGENRWNDISKLWWTSEPENV